MLTIKKLRNGAIAVFFIVLIYFTHCQRQPEDKGYTLPNNDVQFEFEK